MPWITYAAMTNAVLQSCLGLLIALALVAPTALKPIKLALLALSLTLVGLQYGRLLPRGATRSLSHFLAFSVIGIFYCGYGFLQGAPGATQFLGVAVVWPLVYWWLSLGTISPESLRHLGDLLTGCTVLVCFLALSPIVFPSLGVADWLTASLGVDLWANVYEGHTEIRFKAIGSLFFLVPFSIKRATNELIAPRSSGGRRACVLTLAAIVAVVTAILSGRRALIGLLLLAPLWLPLRSATSDSPTTRQRFRSVIGLSLSLVVISALACLLASAIGLVSIAGVAEQLASAIPYSEQVVESTDVRIDQAFSMVSEWWQQARWLGFGFGSSAPVLRGSEEQPWAYELQYVYLLYATGLIGVGCYCIWFFWQIRLLHRQLAARPAIARQEIDPLMVGLIGLLLGNATNPYLPKFDYLWLLFLPTVAWYALVPRGSRKMLTSRPKTFSAKGGGAEIHANATP
jgi:hypothetical protein